jgi:Holliday junction resolvasome RuvABC DNA-binding subunit
MNMDLDAIKESLVSMATALNLLKQLKDSLPKGSNKEEATKALEQAERQLKLAEAQTMHSLGYEICRNHELPEIMLSKDDLNWECPKCKNKKYTGMTSMPNPFYN